MATEGSDSTPESFSSCMRRTTRDAHKLSDSLINAKLAFALSDDAVWADGLQVFYEIFRFLESHVPDTILPNEFHRTAAFEADIAHYLGPSWSQEYVPRKAVTDYLDHLNGVHKTNPKLLLAYVYHLYMGLLSGGQILQKKRALSRKFAFSSSAAGSPGMSVTKFPQPIGELKRKMRNFVDTLDPLEYDDETKANLLVESRRVFLLNNTIVRSIEGAGRANIKQLILFVVIALVFLLIYLVAV